MSREAGRRDSISLPNELMLTEEEHFPRVEEDTIATKFLPEPLTDRSLYEVLFEVALDPDTGEEQIFESLAETLAAHGQGFAYLNTAGKDGDFVLRALFDAQGTILFGDIGADNGDGFSAQIHSKGLAELDDDQRLIQSIGDLELPQGVPITHLLERVFGQEPLAAYRMRATNAGPSLILISLPDEGHLQLNTFEDFSRALSIALEIGRLKSRFVHLQDQSQPMDEAAGTSEHETPRSNAAVPQSANEAAGTEVDPDSRPVEDRLDGAVPLITNEAIGGESYADPNLLVDRFAKTLAAALAKSGSQATGIQRSSELNALYDMALEIATEQDLRSLLRTSLRWTTKLLDCVMGAVFLLDPSLDQMTLAAEMGLPNPQGVVYLAKGFGLAGRVWEQGKAITLDHQRGVGDPGWIESCYAQGAAVGVPLISGHEVFGVLALFEPSSSRTFAEHDVNLLERISAQIAIGIENVERHEKINRRLNQLRVVHDLARRIGTILDLDQLYDEVVERVANGLNLELVVLFMIEDGVLLEKSSYYLPEDRHGAWAPLQLKIGKEGICGQVAKHGEPILCTDVSANPDYVRVLPFEKQICSAAAVPLKLKGQVTGVLLAESERLGAFDQTDVDALQALAAHVSTSIENARLYQETLLINARIDESEKLRSLGLMTSGIAHDFNNLLAVILSRTELALKRVTDEEVRRDLEQVIASARDGGETIHRLQEFARTRKNTSDFVALDINLVAAEAIEISQPMWKDQAQNNGIDIAIIEDFQADRPVLGAEAQLREVLVNLIFNAVEAMPRGGMITIRTSSQDGGVQVRIEDTGVGMTKEVKEQVFVPFFTTKPGGTGLGMSMVYGVIKRHGGTIEIESQPNRGTTIELWLPCSEEGEVEERERKPEAENQISTPAKILIVEDEKAIREVLCETFSNAGHEVFSAADGEEGFARFLEIGNFDVVITDLGMPKLSGWELIEQLRIHDPDLPIIVLSGWGDEIDLEKVKKYHIARMIGKPFSVDGLHAALYEVMQLRKLANND